MSFGFFTLCLYLYRDCRCLMLSMILVDEFISIVLNEHSENGETSPVNYFSVMTNNTPMLTAKSEEKIKPTEFTPIRSIVFIIFANSFNVCNKIYSFTSEIKRLTKNDSFWMAIPFYHFYIIYFFLRIIKSLNEFLLDDLASNDNRVEIRCFEKYRKFISNCCNGTFLVLFQMLRNIN